MKLLDRGKLGKKDEDGKWMGLCMACDGEGLTHTKSYSEPELEILLTGFEDVYDAVMKLHNEVRDHDEFVQAMPTLAFFIMCAEVGMKDDEFIHRMKATAMYQDYENNL